MTFCYVRKSNWLCMRIERICWVGVINWTLNSPTRLNTPILVYVRCAKLYFSCRNPILFGVVARSLSVRAHTDVETRSSKPLRCYCLCFTTLVRSDYSGGLADKRPSGYSKITSVRYSMSDRRPYDCLSWIRPQTICISLCLNYVCYF